jgi:uncharacterized protein (DUF58 family)
MLSVAAEQLQSLAADWSRRRQGQDPHVVSLKRRRVYILPTRFGLVFACLVFAMLLGSLNYGASLGFALTFLLGGLGLVIMHHCRNNLLGTAVRFAGSAPVFAGDEIHYRIALKNEARIDRYDLTLSHAGAEAGPIDLSPGHSRTLILAVAARRRGYQALERFAVSTRHPGSLFRAWSWVHMDARCLIYPLPAAPGRPFPLGHDGHGSHGLRQIDDADFVGLREATPADPPRRLAWKAFARNDQLMVKQFSGTDEEPCLFHWDSLPDLDLEARLSQLTRWCLDAADDMRSFGIELPGVRIPLGTGDRHLHECLQQLALFERPV